MTIIVQRNVILKNINYNIRNFELKLEVRKRGMTNTNFLIYKNNFN
jgi:hypothetical protein